MIKEPDWRQLKNELRQTLEHRPGVDGFGVGENCLRIYVSDKLLLEDLPREYKGVPVEIVHTGEITAQ